MKLALVAAVAAAVFGGTPVLALVAQAGPNPMAGVAAADVKTVNRCKMMKHDEMMKSPMCQRMMQLYPAAFAGSVSSN